MGGDHVGVGGSEPGTGGSDTGTGGDSGEDPDPKTCPVGVEDGCCPLAVSRGGSDPDCPDLSCDLELSNVITFDDWHIPSNGMTGVGMAWTGSELVLARMLANPDVSSIPNRSYDVVVEWRDAQGTPLRPSTRFLETGSTQTIEGPGSLAYHEGEDLFLYVYHHSAHSRVVTFDSAGVKHWNGRSVEQCTGRTAVHKAWATEEGFVVGLNHYTCAGPGSRFAMFDRYDLLGASTRTTMAPQTSTRGNYSCNSDCTEVVSYQYQNSRARASHWAEGVPVTDNIGTSGSLYGGLDSTAVAFDGSRYLLMGVMHIDDGVSNAAFRFFDSATKNFTGSGTSLSLNKAAWPATMIWTGSGFVAAVPLLDFYTGSLPARNQAKIRIIQIRADGTVHRSFDLEAHQGLMPELQLVDGQVAITWVRTDPGVAESRHLGFLTCQD